MLSYFEISEVQVISVHVRTLIAIFPKIDIFAIKKNLLLFTIILKLYIVALRLVRKFCLIQNFEMGLYNFYGHLKLKLDF